MKINLTKINKILYRVELDNKSIGILSEKVILSILKHLDITEVTKAQAEAIFEEIESKSWNSLLNFIALRERSKKECLNYLKRKFVSDDIVKRLLIKAEEYNYLNDKRFCRLYVESLFENGKSLNYIRYKLAEKGIDETLAIDILNEFASKDKSRLDEIVKKAVKKYESFSENKRFEKTMNYLIRNGFEYYEIKEKVKNVIYKG